MRLARFAALAVLAGVSGCADAPTVIPAPTQGPSMVVTTVTVSCPGSMKVGDVGGCLAYGYDSSGRLVSTSAWWSSSNPGSISVGSGGMVTAHAPPGAGITATIDGVRGSRYISVGYTRILTSIGVSPSPTTVAKGYTRQLTATAYDQYGVSMSGVAFTWSSGNTALATVSTSGLVRGVELGDVSISAAAGGKIGSAAVTVVRPPVLVRISGSQYVSLHQSAQYTASASGGVPGYTYEWRTRQGNASYWGAWQNWFSTGLTNYTYASINSCGLDRNQIEVRVTDSTGAQATSSYTVYVTNPC